MILNKIGRHLLFVLLALLGTACTAEESAPDSTNLPRSIDTVKTYRVGDSLVRMIKHNMEISPRFDIELLSSPHIEIKETLSIQKINVDGEALDFESSQGVFVEDFGADDSSVFVEFDYFYPDSGSDFIICRMKIEKGTIGNPRCNKK